jgi:Sulfotransferase family
MTFTRCTKSTVRALLGLNTMTFMDSPVFVVACGRSGSTALCTALGQHPNILMAGPEAPFMHRIAQMAHDYAFGKDSPYYQTSVQLDTFRFRETLKRLCYTSVFGEERGFSYHPLRVGWKNSVFFRGRGIQYWGAKAFLGEEATKGLLWLYPRAKFIYLHRNGLDVVHSMSKFEAFRTLGFDDRCRFWSERAAQYAHLLRDGNSLTVRFDDFVADNAAVFESICTYLELAGDPRPANYASSTLIHPLDKPTENGDAKAVLMNRKPGYLDWTAEQRSAFKGLCAEAMGSLGYEMPF